jgi:hypothetical protein
MRRMGSHGPWTQRAGSTSCPGPSSSAWPIEHHGIGIFATIARARSTGPLLGAFRAHWDMPFPGEIRGSVNAVLCRKEQQSRIHMLAHAHGRPNGSSDIQREQSFLSRIALKPTSRVLCPSGCSHDLHALVAASREPLRSNTLYPVVVCSEYQGSVTTSRRPSKASASLHKGVTRCLVWGRPPAYTKIRWVNRLGTGRSMAAAGQSTR